MYFFVALILFVASCSAQFVDDPSANSMCTFRNGYLPVNGNCDAYTECKEYKAINLQCPDGLYFDTTVSWPMYPCGYPQDVSCQERNMIQPANPTSECPHLYGYYASPSAGNDCGRYRMCVEGRAFDMYCPPGIAFNPDIARCDWPENVPSCKANDFLGAICPPGAVDGDGNPIVTNIKYQDDCYAFYSCLNGNARLLACDPGFAFDPTVERCVDEDLVSCGQPIIMA